MPIPNPQKDEKKREFIARCNKQLATEYPKSDVRNGICYTSWNDRNKKK